MKRIIMNNKVKLNALGFSFNQSKAGTYGLVMTEDDGVRRLIIVIGSPEAQSIAFKLQGSEPPRPLTHDLLKNVMQVLGGELVEVRVYQYIDGVFYSKLLIKQNGYTFEVESRTSDAIALALRTEAPVYTTEDIMQRFAVVFDENEARDNGDADPEPSHADASSEVSVLSDEELQAMLDKAIANEDYELASTIRDMLSKKE